MPATKSEPAKPVRPPLPNRCPVCRGPLLVDESGMARRFGTGWWSQPDAKHLFVCQLSRAGGTLAALKKPGGHPAMPAPDLQQIVNADQRVSAEAVRYFEAVVRPQLDKCRNADDVNRLRGRLAIEAAGPDGGFRSMPSEIEVAILLVACGRNLYRDTPALPAPKRPVEPVYRCPERILVRVSAKRWQVAELLESLSDGERLGYGGATGFYAAVGPTHEGERNIPRTAAVHALCDAIMGEEPPQPRKKKPR